MLQVCALLDGVEEREGAIDARLYRSGLDLAPKDCIWRVSVFRDQLGLQPHNKHLQPAQHLSMPVPSVLSAFLTLNAWTKTLGVFPHLGNTSTWRPPRKLVGLQHIASTGLSSPADPQAGVGAGVRSGGGRGGGGGRRGGGVAGAVGARRRQPAARRHLPPRPPLPGALLTGVGCRGLRWLSWVLCGPENTTQGSRSRPQMTESFDKRAVPSPMLKGACRASGRKTKHRPK